MDAELLGQSMRDATDQIELRPDFTAAVLRGARRRRARRRTAAAGAALCAALAGGAAVAVWPAAPPGQEQLADARFDQPTRGDLGGDRQFTTDVVAAWRNGVLSPRRVFPEAPDDLRGDPHVYWAGTTEAGPAAVVLQRVRVGTRGSARPGDADQITTLVGLVATDPANGQLTLVKTYTPHVAGGDYVRAGFQFGPGDRTVLALDDGEPMFVSAGATYAQTGAVTRSWQEVPRADGVGVVTLPEGTDPGDVRLVVRQPPRPTDREPDPQTFVGLYQASAELSPTSSAPSKPDHTLPWWETGVGVARVGATPGDEPDEQVSDVFDQALAEAAVTDPLARHSVTRWNVLAGRAGGGTAIIGERQDGDRPSRLFTVLRDANGAVTQVLFSGEVDPTAPLPVHVRLPDGQGWVVAAYGSSLRYRTGPGEAWRTADTGRDAGLLPDPATEVEVTPRGGAPVVVPLPR
ncbi:hypothetical protein LX83_003816 [Goodfellowiella coeruleoviolacea]|uniref:Uncharacterized protein n=2 Tax=Goodfellowiella coeruleoviolacea TaxID=334858 RepID=A0AAE3GGJ0_9PSEU|nr:hypothetical protein [Goodfellowiella coeruleoviolacea]